MGKKSKKQKKRDLRDEEAEEREAGQRALDVRRRRYRVAAAVLPVLVLAASLGVYFAWDDRQLAGLVGLIGIAVWVPVLLGSIGGEIRPRDRVRAGSIDFGSKR